MKLFLILPGLALVLAACGTVHAGAASPDAATHAAASPAGRGFDPRELLAYTLLHRHSNLPECLAQLPAPPEPTLDSLAPTWFGIA